MTMLRRSVAAAPAMWSTSDGKAPTTTSRPDSDADDGSDASVSGRREGEHRHVDRDVRRRAPARVGGDQVDPVADPEQRDGRRRRRSGPGARPGRGSRRRARGRPVGRRSRARPPGPVPRGCGPPRRATVRGWCDVGREPPGHQVVGREHRAGDEVVGGDSHRDRGRGCGTRGLEPGEHREGRTAAASGRRRASTARRTERRRRSRRPVGNVGTSADEDIPRP